MKILITGGAGFIGGHLTEALLKRGDEVIRVMKETGAVYFGAIGGAGALLSRCIKSARVVCYKDLGAEAVRELVVEDLPLTVVIDSEGNNLYELGPAAYLEHRKQNNG